VELTFPDGNGPPKAVIKQWLKLVKDHFGKDNNQHSHTHKPEKLKTIESNEEIKCDNLEKET
jgi:hypothetical protein